MNRLSDWEPRLADYLEWAGQQTYAYGRHDCLLYCAGAVKAVTGKDLAGGHRGKYRTEKGAARYLAKLGHRSPASLIDSLLPEKPIAKAMRGDIILDDDGICGVVIGGDALMAGDGGLKRVPRAQWRRAWAV